MKLKHAVMVGLMSRQADRFHEYQPAREFAECLQMTKRVRGVDGIEVLYPLDFADPKQTIAMIRDSGLPVAAVNLNVKSAARWRAGSFTSPDMQVRAAAVSELKTAMDLAAELETPMVTVCPLMDGHNYRFQVDYVQQWGWLEEGIAAAGRHRSDVRISLEYELCECRNYSILGDLGRTLYLCERLGQAHVGVTLDVGHALVAKESPAEAICLAARADRLFYVHLADNARDWGWDMLPGSVNLWDLLEVLFYLDRLEWEGWLACGVLTRHGDPVKTLEASIAIVNAAHELLDKLGRERLQEFIAEGIPARAFETMVRSLL